MHSLRPFLMLLIAISAAGCAQDQIARTTPLGVAPNDGVRAGAQRAEPQLGPMTLGNGKIRHVVIVIQENRSVDNLFNGLPGADTRSYGINSAGKRVPLSAKRLTAPYDLDHSHIGFVTEWDNGKMDGFSMEDAQCLEVGRCGNPATLAYGAVPQSEVQPYFDMATQYVFADRMFATNQGPSFPAHQYLLTGTSTVTKDSNLRASAKALAPSQKVVGGCDSPAGSLALTIDGSGEEAKEVFPCFERPSLTDLIDAKSLTWHYYVNYIAPSLWNAPDAIKHIRDSSEYAADVVAPSSAILKDVAAGQLADVVWLTPSAKESDHAGVTNGSGPSWVASVVNAIGQSRYWNDTAIFLLWDDWGGWYDHVSPPEYNSYELGFRVPLVVISPYAKKGYVSHKQHEFGSILKFAEEVFGLGSLGTTDVRADNLEDAFDFAQKPRKFVRIKAPLPGEYFLREGTSTQDIDDDY